MPWSASSGATKKIIATATAASATARKAIADREGFALLIERRSLGDDVLERRPGKYREDRVVEPEESEIRARLVRDARADAADDEGDRERQEEQWEQHLAPSRRGRHRRDERPDRADPERRQGDAR